MAIWHLKAQHTEHRLLFRLPPQDWREHTDAPRAERSWLEATWKLEEPKLEIVLINTCSRNSNNFTYNWLSWHIRNRHICMFSILYILPHFLLTKIFLSPQIIIKKYQPQHQLQPAPWSSPWSSLWPAGLPTTSPPRALPPGSQAQASPAKWPKLTMSSNHL